MISEAVEKAGYSLGDQIFFALDAAVTELYENGIYNLAIEGKKLTVRARTGYSVGSSDRPASGADASATPQPPAARPAAMCHTTLA